MLESQCETTMSVTVYPTIHYYVAPATREVAEYLRNGGKEFFTRKDYTNQTLTVRFLATPEYVEKMRNRPFLKGVEITRKA